MRLEKLLEYQDIDIQLRRQLDVVEKSDDAKRIEQAKNEFASIRKIFQETERMAKQHIDYFESAKKFMAEINQKVNQIEKALESGNQEEAQKLIDELTKIKNNLSELEEKIAERKKRAEGVIKKFESANEYGRKVKSVYSAASERQNTLMSKIEPQVERLKAKLKELEPDIDPEIMKRYKSLTAEHKYPAFVEAYLDDKVFSCRGCGIALSKTNSSVLTEKGYTVCESCRRIIYKK